MKDETGKRTESGIKGKPESRTEGRPENGIKSGPENGAERGLPAGAVLLSGSADPDDTPWEPFADMTMEFLGALSDRIRGLKRTEAGEEIKSLGFWLRKSHLMEFKETYDRPESLGLGQTFHIAPSNVPLMFVYSMAIGLLAGNTCRVRLSERRSGEDEKLCKLIDEVLKEERFSLMRNRISIVSYDRENRELTEQFSRECDARIIWGGDRTVEEIRKIPMKPRASELVFPDRTSIAVLGAEAVLALSEEDLNLLAGRFYNDTYGMDQNACSCPKLVFWQEEGKEAGRQASDRFWNAVAAASERYALSEIKVSQKYGALWECAGLDAQIRQVRRWKNRLYVLETVDIPESSSESRMQFGSFLEYHMKEKEDWLRSVSEKTQTVTFFGVDREGLRNAVLLQRVKGTHRIVPVGQALQMDLIWDGKDLIGHLSRTVH